MSNQLQVIVEESGLEKTKAQYLLDNFTDYFEIASKWEKNAKTIVVTDESQKDQMELARVGRLFLREKRISLEKARKKLKEQSLREGKAIDGIANVLKAVIVPIEEYLSKQEKFVEIQEEKKREALRIEAENKAEEERLEKERIQKLHEERKIILLPYIQWWEPELSSINYGELTQSNFDNILSSLNQEKADYEKEQERIRVENEKLKEEAEEKERKAKEEKERHEKQLAEERAKAEADKQKQEQKLRKEKEKAAAAKKKQDEKLKKEREEAEKKRQEAEKKAKEEQEKIKKEAEEKAEKERKEKERLEELLKNQVECPFCKKKFQAERKNK